MGQMQIPKNIAGNAPAGATQSQAMMMKKMKGSQMPTDIGLLPLTFVSPSFKELREMYKDEKRKLLSVLWLRFRRSIRGPLQ